MGCCVSTAPEPKIVSTEQEKVEEKKTEEQKPEEQKPKEQKTEEEKKSDGKTRNIDQLDNRITVNIIQGRNLPAADAIGSSDPYVKVTFVSKSNPDKPLEESRTRIISNRSNPVWNDTIVCEGVGIISDCKAIIFDVWDYDTATADDFLGTASITNFT
ncbi:hypothetical protein RFI_10022, partial [Reticulomyxa filosa]